MKKLFAVGALLFVLGMTLYELNSVESTRAIMENQYLPQVARVRVDAVKIDVSVKPGGYVKNKWILDGSASFASPSAFGKVIYGHDNDKIFGNLKKISVGDYVVLTDQSGKTKNYLVFWKER